MASASGAGSTPASASSAVNVVGHLVLQEGRRQPARRSPRTQATEPFGTSGSSSCACVGAPAPVVAPSVRVAEQDQALDAGGTGRGRSRARPARWWRRDRPRRAPAPPRPGSSAPARARLARARSARRAPSRRARPCASSHAPASRCPSARSPSVSIAYAASRTSAWRKRELALAGEAALRPRRHEHLARDERLDPARRARRPPSSAATPPVQNTSPKTLAARSTRRASASSALERAPAPSRAPSPAGAAPRRPRRDGADQLLEVERVARRRVATRRATTVSWLAHVAERLAHELLARAARQRRRGGSPGGRAPPRGAGRASCTSGRASASTIRAAARRLAQRARRRSARVGEVAPVQVLEHARGRGAPRARRRGSASQARAHLVAHEAAGRCRAARSSALVVVGEAARRRARRGTRPPAAAGGRRARGASRRAPRAAPAALARALPRRRAAERLRRAGRTASRRASDRRGPIHTSRPGARRRSARDAARAPSRDLPTPAGRRDEHGARQRLVDALGEERLERASSRSRPTHGVGLPSSVRAPARRLALAAQARARRRPARTSKRGVEQRGGHLVDGDRRRLRQAGARAVAPPRRACRAGAPRGRSRRPRGGAASRRRGRSRAPSARRAAPRAARARSAPRARPGRWRRRRRPSSVTTERAVGEPLERAAVLRRDARALAGRRAAPPGTASARSRSRPGADERPRPSRRCSLPVSAGGRRLGGAGSLASPRTRRAQRRERRGHGRAVARAGGAGSFASMRATRSSSARGHLGRELAQARRLLEERPWRAPPSGRSPVEGRRARSGTRKSTQPSANTSARASISALAARLLRRHVPGRADAPRPVCVTASRRAPRARDAEVDDLGLRRPPTGRKRLRRLDVAVDDAARVRGGERLGDARARAPASRATVSPAAPSRVAQILALEPLHREVGVARPRCRRGRRSARCPGGRAGRGPPPPARSAPRRRRSARK